MKSVLPGSTVQKWREVPFLDGFSVTLNKPRVAEGPVIVVDGLKSIGQYNFGHPNFNLSKQLYKKLLRPLLL